MNLSLLDLPDNESRTGSDSPRLTWKCQNSKTALYLSRWSSMPFHFGILERTWTVVMRDHWGYHWPLLWVIILGDGHWGDTEGTFDVAYEDSAVYSEVYTVQCLTIFLQSWKPHPYPFPRTLILAWSPLLIVTGDLNIMALNDQFHCKTSWLPMINFIVKAAELQSALASLPKSFSSQLSQYAQYSSLQQVFCRNSCSYMFHIYPHDISCQMSHV